MKLYKHFLYLHIVMVLVVSSSLSQSWKDRKDALGVGVSFGTASPITDVKGPKDGSIGRAFVRYYPSDYTGFEAGIGIGLLEAEVKPLSFFSSLIVPVDARLVIQPLKEGKIQPLLFGGVGFVNFNPVDKQHQELPRNAFGEYGHLAAYVPLGGGLQYFISDNTAIELAASYNMLLSDNLDDIKSEGNDAYWSVMVNLFAFVKSTNDDLDGDGLKNDEEKQIGTDPLNPDTDGDGLRDGEEVLTYKTNPLKKDTDDDGLGDKEEIFAYKTDPLNKDSDKDRLTDGEEVLKYSTNPLKADTDGDGLTDGDEVLTYHTNPLKVDTDGDGLGDGDEVLKYKTDPLKVDTDSDGLSDGDEILKHKTDPLKEDTDSGGMADGKEIQAGLNPLDPNDDVPIIKVGERIILEGVNFETGKTTLLPEAQVILDQVAASLTANPTAEVAIHGHTDNVGGAKYNMNLSMGRAVAVKEYLVTKGVDASRITTKGFGFTKPIGDNATPAGRAKNRRIEFMRIK